MSLAGHYVPGFWVLFSGPKTWLLADVADRQPELDGLWILLERGATLADVLDAIGQLDGASFALLHTEPGAERVVVRGTGRARLVNSDGDSVELTCPPGVPRWLEFPLDGIPDDVHLSSGDTAAGGTRLPIAGGVAHASSADIGRAQQLGGASTPSDEVTDANEGKGHEDASATPALTNRGSENAYDHLFGETRLHTIDDAAVREEGAEDEEDGLPSPASGSIAEGLPVIAASAPIDAAADPARTLLEPPEVEPSAPPTTEASLIASVPGVARMPPPDEDRTTVPLESERDAKPPVSVAQYGDEVDDRTRTRAEIDAIAGRQATLVQAISCPNGHPNPPHSEQCRVCRVPIAAVSPHTIPRPTLGMLELSTGDSIPLDRGAIFGRAPDAPEGDGERPNVVRVPSPTKDISRNHVEVRVDGWHVLVVDLQSTNGTLIRPPGQEALRLHPGEPALIQPGTEVDLGDGVSFRYEVNG